nr:Hint domain-containing protein [uncultured Rhodopila sp.]
MANKTYTWFGGSGLAGDSSNWTPNGPPGPGDTAIVNAGTVLLSEGQLNSNTLLLNAATFDLTNFTGTVANSSFDGSSTLVAGAAEFAVAGGFLNNGTIETSGTAGNTTTIAIDATTVAGAIVPGIFINQGEIDVTAGDTLVIAIGATSELLNPSVIQVDGGYLDIMASSSSSAGGYAPVAGVIVLTGGGTVETNASYGTSVAGVIPYYAFGDSTAGNTVKVDKLDAFSGRFLAFGANDTIDLGASLSVGSLVYNSQSGLLYLENGGSIVDTLLFASGDFSAGTFALTGLIGAGSTATAGSFGLTLGADGDTELVTSVRNNVYDNGGGTWQTSGDWSNGTPGTLDTTLIGLGSSGPFTLTTGSTPVSTGALALVSNDALLQITSPTTIGPYTILQFDGTLEVTNGQTLTATSLRALGGTVTVDPDAVLKLTGHHNFGSGPSSYVASVNGTLAVANTNTLGVAESGGTLLVTGGTIAAGGSLNAASGTYAGGGSFTIGEDGAGTPAQVVVTGTAGTPAVVTDTYSVLSSDLTSSGDLTLNGAVSWTDAGDTGDSTARGYMLVGNNNLAGNLPGGTAPAPSGEATLLVENGASLTETNYADIGYTVDSAGSATIESGGIWTIGSNGLGIGYAGSGTLEVLSGGTVKVGGSGFSAGHLFGADGTLLVGGAGALLTTTGGFADGKAGQGFTQVLNGGTIAMTGTSGISVGQSAGSSGTLVVGATVALASAFLTLGTAASGLTVGGSGAGTLAVLSDGTLSMNGTGGISVGQSSFGGVVTVSGPGAFLKDGSLSSGIGIGVAGPGELDIVNAGTVSVAGRGVSAGKSLGATGTISVTGGALIVTNPTSGLYIGQTGDGTLAIGAGGIVSAAAGVNVASSGGTGTVTVNGGTLLATAAPIILGSNGQGSLAVTGGGRVSADGLTIGGGSGGGGTATVVNGTVSVAGLNHPFFVGYTNASGFLSIGSGGTVVTGTLLDINATGTGQADVRVDSGTLIGTSSFYNGLIVGDTGSGSLDIRDLGIVNTGSSEVSVGNQAGGNGTLTVEYGGRLEAGGLSIATPGSGSATGIVVIGTGGVAILNGATSFNGIGGQGGGSGTLIVDAGTLSAGNFNIGGTNTSGELLVTDGGQLRTGSAPGGYGSYIGPSGTGTASVTVSNTGTWTAANGIVLANGSLDISSGGLVNTGTSDVSVGAPGGTATLTVENGGTLSAAGLMIATSPTSGAIGLVEIGPAGLVILNGGTTQSSQIGFGSGNSGTLIVNGGTLSETGSFFGIDGTAASSTVLVENGGTVNTTFLNSGPVVDINATDGGTASVTVTGADSVWNSTGNQFVVGDSGGGNLTISDGGVVNAGTSVIDIGNQLGGNGTVVVGGSGATLLGSQISMLYSGTLAVDAGGTVDIGTASFGNAEVMVDGGLLHVGALFGAGDLKIQGNGTVSAFGAISQETIAFVGTGLLQVGSAQNFLAGIAGFASGDTIDLTSLGYVPGATAEIAGGVLSVTSGGTTDTLSVSGIADGAAFTTSRDAAGTGTDIGLLCFCAGTHIATPAGSVPVEKLRIGDLVRTFSGRSRPIGWIGVGRVLATRGRRNAATPIIVRKGALADNVPYRDLHVTKGHSICLDGVLIPAEYLVNHRSIVWDDRAQEVSLYHIELETHDVLLADGAPAESYRDDGNRWLFRNANSGWDQPPKPPCLPVLTGGPMVDAIWQRLLDRAGPRPGLPLTDDPELHLLVDGEVLRAVSNTGHAAIFRLQAHPKQVRIVSNASIPCELGLARDSRVLGVALTKIAIRQETRFTIVAAKDGRLAEGFHALEPDSGLRWTNGDAVLPTELFDGFEGPMEVVLHIGCTTRYPLLSAA